MGIGVEAAVARECTNPRGAAFWCPRLLLAFLFIPFPLQFALFLRFSAAARCALHGHESRALMVECRRRGRRKGLTKSGGLPLTVTALNARKIETFLRFGAVWTGGRRGRQGVGGRLHATRWPRSRAVIAVFFAGRCDLY